MVIELRCYAKVNLSLDIKGLLDNGFHNLDMIMTNIDLYDKIKVVSREDKNINLICDVCIPKEKNSAYRMAESFINKFGTNGIDIYIKKNIPLSGGLGGSSADAAGVVFALCKIFGIDIEKTYDIVNSIGSDIWYLIKGGLVRAKGQGNLIEPLNYRQFYIILAKPENGVNTSQCFKKYDEMNKDNSLKINFSIDKVIENLNEGKDFKNYLFNVLEQPAIDLNKDISPILESLKTDENSLGTVMSGSGSSVISIYDNKKDAKKGLKLCKDFFYKTVIKTRKEAIDILKIKK